MYRRQVENKKSRRRLQPLGKPTLSVSEEPFLFKRLGFPGEALLR